MKDLRNRVQLIGNLGMDPEVKSFDGGRKLAKFSVATSQSYTSNKGERVKDTQWHNIIAWGKLAEILRKGAKWHWKASWYIVHTKPRKDKQNTLPRSC